MFRLISSAEHLLVIISVGRKQKKSLRQIFKYKILEEKMIAK